LLDPSGAAALHVTGNGSVQTAGGTAVVNSKSTTAITVDGHGLLDVGELDVVGAPGTRVTGQGRITGTIHAGIMPQSDPFAAMHGPDPPAADCPGGNCAGDLYPGTYENGIHVSGQATVTLHPGIYYVKGSFDVSGLARVRGDGVTIFINTSTAAAGV